MELLRKLAPWLGLYVLLMVLLLMLPNQMHTTEFNHAFFVWNENPTPENKAALDRAKRHKDEEELVAVGIASLVLVGGISGVYYTGRYSLRKLKNHLA